MLVAPPGQGLPRRREGSVHIIQAGRKSVAANPQYGNNSKTVSTDHLQETYLRGAVLERDAATANRRNIVRDVYKIVAAPERKSFAEGIFNPRHRIRREAGGAAPEAQDDAAAGPGVHQPFKPRSPGSSADVGRKPRAPPPGPVHQICHAEPGVHIAVERYVSGKRGT